MSTLPLAVSRTTSLTPPGLPPAATGPHTKERTPEAPPPATSAPGSSAGGGPACPTGAARPKARPRRPRRSDKAAALRLADVEAEQPRAGGANPEAGEGSPPRSDEQMAKRAMWLAEFKAGAEYQRYSAQRQAEEAEQTQQAGAPAPRTPDPYDKRISRRGWNAATRHWKQAIRQH